MVKTVYNDGVYKINHNNEQDKYYTWYIISCSTNRIIISTNTKKYAIELIKKYENEGR